MIDYEGRLTHNPQWAPAGIPPVNVMALLEGPDVTSITVSFRDGSAIEYRKKADKTTH